MSLACNVCVTYTRVRLATGRTRMRWTWSSFSGSVPSGPRCLQVNRPAAGHRSAILTLVCDAEYMNMVDTFSFPEEERDVEMSGSKPETESDASQVTSVTVATELAWWIRFDVSDLMLMLGGLSLLQLCRI